MEASVKATGDVVVTADLANKIIEALETIVQATTSLGDAVLTLTAPPAAEPIAAAAPAVAEPIVWDTTPEALENYDAEQLVALRAVHRADNHSVTGCAVCAVLLRRLGNL